MQLNIQKGFEKIKTIINHYLSNDRALDIALEASEFTMGLPSNPAFALPPSIQIDPIYVGVKDSLGQIVATDELKTLMKTSPNKIGVRPKYNPQTRKFDIHYFKQKTGVMDADPFIAGQLFSPWLVSYFEKIFKKPLLYSAARELVKTYSGSNPWAKIMTLFLADYAGFGTFKHSGTPQNNMTQDINVKSGMMSSEVINMNVTYSLEMEEQELSKRGDYPFANKMMMTKAQYGNYVLDLVKSFLIYYGNSATGTIGLFSRNSITAWTGDTLAEIKADGGNTAKGSLAYNYLYGIIIDFLSPSYNKFNVIHLALAPDAYNYLSFLPYSDQYDSRSVLAVLAENLSDANNKIGRPIEVKFFSDPMLAANTIFNDNAYDYLVVSSPEVKGTAEGEENQDLILCGIPLDEFVYPVIPGQYATQHKILSRFAGIFAPVAEAIKVYSGFGKA